MGQDFDSFQVRTPESLQHVPQVYGVYSVRGQHLWHLL